MNASRAATEHFLVEWYDPILTAAPLPQTVARLEKGADAVRADGAPVSFELALSAPGDAVLFGVFSADDAEAVLTACRRAGCPPDRITDGIRTYLRCPEHPGSTPQSQSSGALTA